MPSIENNVAKEKLRRRRPEVDAGEMLSGSCYQDNFPEKIKQLWPLEAHGRKQDQEA